MDLRLLTASPSQDTNSKKAKHVSELGDKESVHITNCLNEKERIPTCNETTSEPSQADHAQPFHTSHDNSKSYSCYRTSDFYQFWEGPFKFFQIVVRELSVLLILIETLILLGGYLMILAVHHSLRYLLSKIYHKSQNEDQVSYNAPLRHYQHYNDAPGVVPRRVPRGRMAGG